METSHTLLAALPVLCVIGLILLRVPALYAVIVSIAVALALTVWFPIEGAQLAARASSLSTVTVSVMFILLGGIVLSEHLAASGAQDRISDWLGQAAGGFERSLLMIGLCVAPLAESLVGFGVGVIIAVPLFTRLGLGLTKAATVGLLGLTMGAFLPYGVLTLSMLTVSAFNMLVGFGAWTALFTSPGLWLMLTAAFTPLLLGIARRDASVSMGRGARLWIPIASVNVLYILFGTLLSVNGMTAELAAQAAGLGQWFIPLVPIIGFLGGYITNSNSGSAAMLAGGLTGASQSLGVNPAATLGLQNSTTGFSSTASPSRIELAQRVAQRDALPTDEKVDAVAILKTVLISCGAAVGALIIGAIVSNAFGWLAA